MFFSFIKQFYITKKLWVKTIEKKLNYSFKNPKLLQTAFTHKSINSNPNKNYERFELIGDSVVNLSVTHWLTVRYPYDNEGDLTTKRASLVNTFFLSKISYILNLEEHLIISKGVNMKNNVVSKNINADLYESIVGAIFLDSNYTVANKFIINTLIENYNLLEKNINYKGLLIEFCHKNYNQPPEFNVISSSGPDHDKTFNVKVLINKQLEFNGNGKSIKDAEQESAQAALKNLKLI